MEEAVELPGVDEFDDDNDGIHEQDVQIDAQHEPGNGKEEDDEDAYNHPDAHVLQAPAIPDDDERTQRQIGQRQRTSSDETDLGQSRLREDGEKTDDVEHQDNNPPCREGVIQALHAAHRGIIHRHHAHRVDERDEYRNMLFQPSIYLGDRAYRCHHHDDEGCYNDPLGQP